MLYRPSRRNIIRNTLGAGLGITLGFPPSPLRAATVDGLTLYGAPIAVSIPVAQVADRDALQPAAEGLSFHMWRSPDEMRAGVAAGDIQVTTSPAPTAANLYNRGTGMRLVAVLTTGMLYLMTTDGTIARIEDLAGKRVLVPFRGDMPDRVFQLLLRGHGMTLEDVGVEYTATPIEAAQLMLAGRAPAAVLQEPAATVSILRGLRASISVNRVIDFQEVFGKVTGRGADIPMAVLIMRDQLRDQSPDLADMLFREIHASNDWVRNNPVSAAQIGSDYMGMPAPMIERSIPFSNLSVRSPAEVREHLEFFYGELAQESADLLGGRLPDDDFYLDVG